MAVLCTIHGKCAGLRAKPVSVPGQLPQTLCRALLSSYVTLWEHAAITLAVSSILRGTSDPDERVRLGPCFEKRFSDDFRWLCT